MASNTGTAETGEQHGNVKRSPSQTAKVRTKMGRSAETAIGIPGLSWVSIGIVPWEPINGSLFKAAWAELAATLLFIYLTTGSIVFGCSVTDAGTSNNGSSGGQTFLAIATSFGITIFVLVYAAAPFSGGHLNPAVSLAFFITKKLSVPRLILYWTAQLTGAILGSFLVRYTYKTGFNAGKGGTNRLVPGFPADGAWLLETCITFAFIFVIFVATDQKRGQSTSHVPILAPLAIGFTLFVCHLAAIPLDGCSANPARSFGPAVTSGSWEHQWVFWVGPFTGAILAALTYETTFRISHDPILTIDRHDDAAQSAQTVKLPGYTGASGLPSNQEAMEILRHRIASESGKGDVIGSGHIAQNGNGHSNGIRHKPNGGLTASDENMGPNMV